MLTTEDLRFFEVVAESPTLSAAARALDVTAPAVTQRLQSLEARLGVRLLDRSTRHLVLTEEGELLAQQGRVVLSQLDDLYDGLVTRRGEVAGSLRVAAPFGFGRRFVAPAVARFRMAHPETAVTLILRDNPLQLPEEAFDVVLHVGELRDSSRIIQRLAPNERFVCASPEYVARRGEPTHPQQLREHDCLALRENDEDVTLWRFTDPEAATTTVRIDPVMVSNDGDVVRSWAIEGMGVMVRSEWQAAEDLHSNRLVRILKNWSLPSADIAALFGRRTLQPARLTRFLSFMRSTLVGPPWRSPPTSEEKAES